MNDQEKLIYKMLGDVWSQFLKLPVEENEDRINFRAGVANLQTQLLARPTRRNM